MKTLYKTLFAIMVLSVCMIGGKQIVPAQEIPKAALRLERVADAEDIGLYRMVLDLKSPQGINSVNFAFSYDTQIIRPADSWDGSPLEDHIIRNAMETELTDDGALPFSFTNLKLYRGTSDRNAILCVLEPPSEGSGLSSMNEAQNIVLFYFAFLDGFGMNDIAADTFLIETDTEDGSFLQQMAADAEVSVSPSAGLELWDAAGGYFAYGAGMEVSYDYLPEEPKIDRLEIIKTGGDGSVTDSGFSVPIPRTYPQEPARTLTLSAVAYDTEGNRMEQLESSAIWTGPGLNLTANGAEATILVDRETNPTDAPIPLTVSIPSTEVSASCTVAVTKSASEPMVLDVTGPSECLVPSGTPTSLPFTATLLDQYGEPMDAPVTWSLSAQNGDFASGVSVDDAGRVTVACSAGIPGSTEGVTWTLIAESSGLRATKDFILRRSTPVAHHILLYRDGLPVQDTDTIVRPNGDASATIRYEAKTFDQYRVPLEGQSVLWDCEDVPSGILVNGPEITVSPSGPEAQFWLTARDASAAAVENRLCITVTAIQVDWSGVDALFQEAAFTYGDANGKLSLPETGSGAIGDVPLQGVFSYADGSTVQNASADDSDFKLIAVRFTITSPAAYAGVVLNKTYPVLIQKAVITGYPPIPAVSIPANNPKNTGLPALQTLLPQQVAVRFGNDKSADLSVIWQPVSNDWNPKGGVYSYQGAVSAGDNFTLEASGLFGTVEVLPVYVTLPDLPAELTVPLSLTDWTHTGFGLPQQVTVSLEDRAPETVSIRWSPEAAALEKAHDASAAFSISEGFPAWATVVPAFVNVRVEALKTPPSGGGSGGGAVTTPKPEKKPLLLETQGDTCLLTRAEWTAASEVLLSFSLPQGTARINLNEEVLRLLDPDQSLTVVCRAVDREDLNAEAVYEVLLFSGNTPVSRLGSAWIELAFPLAWSSEQGPAALTVLCLEPSGNFTPLSQVSYSAPAKEIWVRTNHLSQFVVFAEEMPGKQPTFSDVSADRWSFAAIEALAEAGILNGVGNGLFVPEAPVSRAAFLQMLANLSGDAATDCEIPFTDVAADAWYRPCVAWALQNGIVAGTTETTFSPDIPITREQMAAMLCRYLTNRGVSLEVVQSQRTFSDADAISDYAVPYVQTLYQAGVMSGIDEKNFAPKAIAAREQAAQCIYLIYK